MNVSATSTSWGNWANDYYGYDSTSTSGTYTADSDNVWNKWCVETTTNTIEIITHTTGTVTATAVWDNWATEFYSTTSNTMTFNAYDTAWDNWNIEHREHISVVERRPVENITDGVREQHGIHYHNNHAEVEDKLQKQKAQAEEVAKELLMELIGPKELETYNRTGKLFVQGKKYSYIIPKEGCIQRIEKDKITKLCVHLENRYKFPETDNVIAMMLAIETNEKQVLDMANKHGELPLPKLLPEAACINQLPI